MAKLTQSDEGSTDKTLLATLRDFSFVGTIYLFFISFVYRDFLLSRLGIPPDDMPSLNSALALAIEPFIVSWQLTLTIAIIASAGYGMGRFFIVSSQRASSRQFNRFAACALGLLLFPILYVLASVSAKTEASNIETDPQAAGSQPASISFQRDRVNRYNQELVHAANHDETYVLYHTSDSIFVMLRRHGKSPFVYEIPKTDVSHVRKDVAE